METPDKRLQHFLNFSSLKKKGAIRIGAFGDSHTYGDEVEKAESYPYQLQELFNNNFPNKKIEVLNFGVNAVGFQEQFFLWEKYAKKYKLDYILLGPQGFYSDRDPTFRKNVNFKKPFHPKTRFVLSKNSQLKQVHIKGRTLKERYKNYYKLIPSWTALRYDRRPFQIWESLFPFLRNKIQNPFYWTSKPMHKEAVEINTLLLRKMKHQHNKKILFFTDAFTMFYNYLSTAHSDNLNFIPSLKNLFYRVFVHESSLGNEWIANIYFKALMGEKDFSLKIIQCGFKRINDYPPHSFSKDLYFAKSIQIIGGKSPISHLKHNSSDHHYNKGTYFNHKVKGTKSFIAFSNTADFSQTPYVPLPIQLKEGMKIYIQGMGKNRLELGSIKSLDAYGKFFNFYAKYAKSAIDIDYTHWFSYFVLDEMPYFLKEKLKDQKQSAELFVEDYQLGALQPDKQYGPKALKFIPTEGYEKTFLMMGPSSGHVREKDFPDEFPLYIQYNMINGESFKSLIPDWKCKKEKELIHLSLPNFEPLTLE